MDYLYKTFLENKQTYRWKKTYWRNEINKIFENDDFILDNYVTDKFANGKLFYDGNPIYSAKLNKQEKSFRIIQENPDEFGDYYTSFINNIDNNIGDYQELVIVLTLTRENKHRALQELLSWIKDNKR
jgi:hypothetical protein